MVNHVLYTVLPYLTVATEPLLVAGSEAGSGWFGLVWFTGKNKQKNKIIRLLLAFGFLIENPLNKSNWNLVMVI